MLKKKENTNELIPQLIDSFNNFNKTVYNRIKFDGIVNFFHSNADKKFNNYVNLSNKRFKSVKSGSRISNILQQQQKNYNNVEKNIINNYLYTNIEEVEPEIEKLEKNNNFYKTKDINEIRQKIKDSLLNFTFKEIEYRKKLDKKIKKKKELEEKKKKENNNKIIDEEINNSFSENENKLNLSDEREDFLQTKELYNEIIKKDQNTFNEKLKNYNNNFIDKIKEITNENENKSIKIDKKQNQKLFSLRYNFYPKSFQFINYRDDIKPKFIKKKHVDADFDIIKIKKFHKKIHLSNPNRILENNLQSYLDKNNKPNSNLLKNTIKVVKTEVENSKFLEDKIALKRENFDDFFNKFYPEETIENFEKKIKNTLYSNYYLTQKNNENNNKNIISNNNNNINNNNKKTKEKKTYSNKLKDIGGKFKEIYGQFKIKWKEDEEQLEKEKQIEKLKQKEIYEFLRNSKIIDRNNQLFIDGYSMRESKTNENIKEFNKSLPKFINYNKKKLNLELNNFFKQKEKIENNEKIKEMENYEKFQENKFNDWYEKQKPWEEFKNRIKKSKNEEISIKIGEKDPLKQTKKIEIKFDKEKEYNDFLNIKKMYSKNTNE